MSCLLGVLTLVFAMGVMVFPSSMQTLCQISYFLVCISAPILCYDKSALYTIKYT